MIRHPALFFVLACTALTACGPSPLYPNQGQSASPAAASPTPSPSHSSTPVKTGTIEPTPTPTGNPDQPNTQAPAGSHLPANLAGIRFEDVDRFLNTLGQTAHFKVYLIDREGNRLAGQVPLEWSSSRPQDFSVDDKGNLKALVTEGFAVIVARIPGTEYEARSVINITGSPTGGGGGGGGGGAAPAAPGNTPPVIQQLTSSNSTVLGGGIPVKMTSGATDTQSTLADSQFSWTCSPQPGCGSFSPATGPTVYWESPSTGGTYQLILTVTDGSLSSSLSKEIVVQSGNGNLQINPP